VSIGRALVGAVLAVAVGGCALLLDRPQPARYYLLTAVANQRLSSRPDLIIGLGPIRIASYLDRPSLLTRLDANRVQPSNVDLWAAPLPQSVTAVLVENLQSLLGPRQVIIYPWYRTAKVACHVRLDIRNLERRPVGITFAARWSVEELGGDGTLRGGTTDVDHAVTPDTPDAAAAALSEAMGQLSEDIARAVDEVTAAR
jgi:uncharacterized lipoprotein YmbA